MKPLKYQTQDGKSVIMDMERHDFQLDDLVERIKDNDHRLVAQQVPEGLKMQALEMMDSIEEDSEAKVVLAADPCYGACVIQFMIKCV